MSDRTRGRGGGDARLLAPWTVAILLATGVAGFVGMLVLGAYAPDWRRGDGRDGDHGGHALSDAATGFSGIVRLAAETGRAPSIVRNPHRLDADPLLVATPEHGETPLDPVLGPRGKRPTLLVLPKWATSRDADHPGWVTIDGLRKPEEVVAVLAPAAVFRIVRKRSGGRPLRRVGSWPVGAALRAPRPLQAIRLRSSVGGDPRVDTAYGPFEPLLRDAAGDVVLGRFRDRPLFVLADPDLLDNRGVHDRDTAAAALAMLDAMDPEHGEGVAFDVTLNGFAHGATPLKLAFEPPFLATTLTLAAALLLALLGTVARFGSPRPRERAIAFGKAALVDNTAALVRKAGAETRLGRRYADAMREAAARLFALPWHMRGAALDDHLDRLARGERFTTLAEAVAGAESRDELVGAARALHDWMGDRRR